MARPRTTDDATLLLQAMQLFWRNGYANTGVRELEDTLGLKAPSLYNRFGSKQRLFYAALQHYLDQVVQARIERYLHAADPLRGLREFFDSSYDYISKRKPALSCLLANTALESHANDPKLTALLQRGTNMVRSAFEDCLRRAKAHRQLRRDADPSMLAEALFLGFQGLLVTSKVERDVTVLKRQTDALFALLPTKD